MKSHGRSMGTDQGVLARVHFNVNVKCDVWVEFLNGVFCKLVLFFDLATLHKCLLRLPVCTCIVFLNTQIISIVILIG